MVYPTTSPADIFIAVAGGESGPHSAILAPFNGTKIVTRAIVRADGTPVAATKDFLEEADAVRAPALF